MITHVVHLLAALAFTVVSLVAAWVMVGTLQETLLDVLRVIAIH